MKAYLECIPCFFKQAIETARFAGASRKTQKKIVDRIAKAIPGVSLNISPPEMGELIYGTVSKVTGKRDPFRKVKDKSNKLALELYPDLKAKVARSRDRLLTAVELAIAGNIIDYGIENTLNVGEEIKRILSAEHRAIKKERKRLFNYPKFKRLLKKSDKLLIIGDNAGEIVFDRILIEEIMDLYSGKEITYAVKEKPIINDALMKDARQCGIDRSAKVVSTGLGIPGVVLKSCSKDFVRIFRRADMIISKGQGNFESLSEQKREVCYLFMAKCPVVASELRCDMGDVILLCQGREG
ncbi:MAG: DUF89 family protein [Candidatus Omnitrophica bacterium]|nr:DUF89 family protein [Candidatus Omnitrophota bacterium]